MAGRVCPWWAAAFTIDIPLRRLVHDPRKIVGPYVEPGMTVIDVGCGVGWFSIPMARMVGERGKVLPSISSRRCLTRCSGGQRKQALMPGHMHLCGPDRLGIDAEAEFALVFAMLHEVPDQRRLLGEIRLSEARRQTASGRAAYPRYEKGVCRSEDFGIPVAHLAALQQHQATELEVELHPKIIRPVNARLSRIDGVLDEELLDAFTHLNLYIETLHHDAGEIVTVAVLLGPAGPISVHTPDVCIRAKIIPLSSPLNGSVSTSARLSPRRAMEHVSSGDESDGRRLAVYYGWSIGGEWSAPKDPRIEFAGQPHLSFQLAGRLPSPADDIISDPCMAFLKEFLASG